jgi:hypothetical protein
VLLRQRQNVGPGGYCSSRHHRLALKSRNEGYERAG